MTAQPTSNFDSEKRNVGEGWQKLIEFVHFYVSLLDPNYEVLQIKEKFGGLRYYVTISGDVDNADNSIIQGIIDMAEQLSFLICEECGGHGRLKSLQGWLKTLCDKDFEELLARREKEREELAQRVEARRAARDAERKSAQSRPS